MKNKIPQKAGIGLRAQHYQYVMNNSPDVPWFEVHTENFFAQGGITHHILQKVRNDYPISFHGVGMSLGSLEGLSKTHLQKTKELVDKFQPALVSEHISWSEIDGVYMNDLLPVPYTKEATDVLVRNINQMQDFIGRQILVENPSSYLEFLNQEMPEYEWTKTQIEAFQKFLPGEDAHCEECKNHAQYNWCSPDLYFHDIFSQKINTEGDFSQEFLCSDCLFKKFKEFIEKEDIYFNAEFFPPYDGDGLGTSFEA